MHTARPGRAIVTDAGERVALHIIRALGRAEVEVVAAEVADLQEPCPGFRSRHASAAQVLSGRHASDSDWADSLLGIGREGDVLIPTCLNSLLRVVRNESTFGNVLHRLLPSEDTLLKANDKWTLHHFGTERDVPAPHTWRPENLAEVERLADLVDFPVIVKLRHDARLYLEPGARYAAAASPDELLETWRHFDEIQPRPLVQQYIAGGSYGFEALYDRDHRCVASFQHRRLVECPPQGGPSAVCESVCEPELEEYGRRLLDELKWTGVAMVEFRRCAETGTFYLLEINPRFWGSVALSEAAGVNFPALYYRCARGEEFETPTYREGVRLRLMPTYLLSGAMSLRRGPRGMAKAISDLRYLFDPRVREGLLTLDDPSGSWAYIRKSLRRGRGGDG